jgi:hypothetical protein
VTPDLDTLLTALYVEIDDHVVSSGQRGPGQPKRLSDAELVCLAVAQVLLGARSEHHWLRMCYARLGHLYPYLPKQPGYHKRLKAAAPLLAVAMDHLARQCPAWSDPVRLIDATPVPCAVSQETVRRSELAGWAGADAQVNTPELQHARGLADNDIEGVVDPREAAVLRLRTGDDKDVLCVGWAFTLLRWLAPRGQRNASSPSHRGGRALVQVDQDQVLQQDHYQAQARPGLSGRCTLVTRRRGERAC